MFVLRSHHIDERLFAPAEGLSTSALGERVAQAVKFLKRCMSSLGSVKGGASTSCYVWEKEVRVGAFSSPTFWQGSRGWSKQVEGKLRDISRAWEVGRDDHYSEEVVEQIIDSTVLQSEEENVEVKRAIPEEQIIDAPGSQWEEGSLELIKAIPRSAFPSASWSRTLFWSFLKTLRKLLLTCWSRS